MLPWYRSGAAASLDLSMWDGEAATEALTSFSMSWAALLAPLPSDRRLGYFFVDNSQMIARPYQCVVLVKRPPGYHIRCGDHVFGWRFSSRGDMGRLCLAIVNVPMRGIGSISSVDTFVNWIAYDPHNALLRRLRETVIPTRVLRLRTVSFSRS